MATKRKSVLILSILLFSLISNVQASEESTPVAQFGTGFTEVVIADTSDDLFDPRDLEFHPGRANELWIANRGDDSITIVHNTGLDNQILKTVKIQIITTSWKKSVRLPLVLIIQNLIGSGALLKKLKTPTVVLEHQINSWVQHYGPHH